LKLKQRSAKYNSIAKNQADHNGEKLTSLTNASELLPAKKHFPSKATNVESVAKVSRDVEDAVGGKPSTTRLNFQETKRIPLYIYFFIDKSVVDFLGHEPHQVLCELCEIPCENEVLNLKKIDLDMACFAERVEDIYAAAHQRKVTTEPPICVCITCGEIVHIIYHVL